MIRNRRVAVAIVLIIAAIPGCGRKTEIEEYQARWIRLKHAPIEEAHVGRDAAVQADIEVSSDIKDVEVLLLYTAGSQSLEVLRMKLLDPGKYWAMIPSHGRGTLIEYYIEARSGDDLAVRVPAQGAPSGFKFYFKGTPDRALLISHIVLMFAALVILIFSGSLALRAIRYRRIVLRIPRLAFLGAIVFFVSSFPLGMAVAYQTYGRLWTGFPVGNDITDNKSLAIVLYWAAATFFYRGSVFRKDPSTDLLPMGPLPYVYLVGVLVTVALYLIPH